MSREYSVSAWTQLTKVRPVKQRDARARVSLRYAIHFS
jgi:hypothetical protein